MHMAMNCPNNTAVSRERLSPEEFINAMPVMPCLHLQPMLGCSRGNSLLRRPGLNPTFDARRMKSMPSQVFADMDASPKRGS